MPTARDAVVELGGVLRVYLAALLHHHLDALLG